MKSLTSSWSARLVPRLLPFLLLACGAACGTAQVPPGGNAQSSGDAFPGAGAPQILPAEIPFVSLEGPYWFAARGRLLFSDVVEANAEGARIYEFDPESRRFSPLRYPSPATAGPTSTNGLAVDAAGNIIACERYNARVVRLESEGALPHGKLNVLADLWPPRSGQPLNAPNDLVVRRDGNIYFTDSDWGTRPGGPHAAMGVYRLTPQGELERAMDIEKPNGIALSPDGATLYVGSDAQAKVWKLRVDSAGALADRALVIESARVPGGFKVPDGICIDDSGNLYVTNNADDMKAITVFDPAGKFLGRIRLPAAPSNCTFGGADRRTMYVTTLHAVYEVRMPTPGLP